MRALPAIAIAAAMSACGDGAGGPSAAVDYFPVAAGNTWEFELTGSGALYDTLYVSIWGTLDVVVGDSVLHETGFGVYEVYSEAVTYLELEGGTWADTTAELETFYWRNDAGQILEYESLDDSTGRLIHSPPIETGRVWYPGPDEPNGSYEVGSTSASASTPFASFDDCALIHHDNPDESAESYDLHAPGVGPVMFAVDITGDSLDMHLEYELTQTNL